MDTCANCGNLSDKGTVCDFVITQVTSYSERPYYQMTQMRTTYRLLARQHGFVCRQCQFVYFLWNRTIRPLLVAAVVMGVVVGAFQLYVFVFGGVGLGGYFGGPPRNRGALYVIFGFVLFFAIMIPGMCFSFFHVPTRLSWIIDPQSTLEEYVYLSKISTVMETYGRTWSNFSRFMSWLCWPLNSSGAALSTKPGEIVIWTAKAYAKLK